MPDYIPSSDAQALEFMETFATKVALSPAVYMMSSADAAAVSAVVGAFSAAQALAVAPETRTSITITARDEARATAAALIRQFAKLIKYNAGISDTAKMAIGVRPVNTNRDPVLVPNTSPALSVVASTMGAQTVRFNDSLAPLTRAKPFGALMVQLYLAVGTTNAENPGAATFHGNYSTSPIPVFFDFPDRGKQATYFARWANQRNQVGPWSSPASLSIAA